MPDFAKAEVSTTTEDLTPYKTFLKRLTVGQTVTLPLVENESSRRVMRHLNAAAREVEVRLARLPTENGAVRFRVLSPEKRQVNITEDAKRVRVEKARATRARRRTEPMPAVDAATSDVAPADETTGMEPAAQAERPDTTQIEAPVEVGQAQPEGALGEPPSEDPVTHELVPPEQQVREADAQAPARSPRPRRRASSAARNGAVSETA